MRLLLISDVHGNFRAFGPENYIGLGIELCLVAGDLTNIGKRRMNECEQARSWLAELGQLFPVLFIFGNHDIGLSEVDFENICNVQCIEDKVVEVNGIRVAGVSMSPCYDMPSLADNWVRMTADPAMEVLAYVGLPQADIVVSHCPPFGIRDKTAPIRNPDGTWEGRHIGSLSLAEYAVLYHPKLIVCGHVHEAHGKEWLSYEGGSTLVVNTACKAHVVEV